MRYNLFVIALMTALPILAHGQDFPLSFNGLLKNGDIVSYQSLEQGYRLSIASQETYELHNRGASEDDQVMIDSEPIVAAIVKAALERRKPPRKGYRYKSEKVSLRWNTSFRKVLFVGNDYVILSKVGSDQPHQALKFAKVSSIGWMSKEPSTYLGPAQEKIAAKESAILTDDDKLTKYAKKIISRYDHNQDGYLVSSEWAKMLMSPVPADADKDGRVTAQEYAKMLSDRSHRVNKK